MERSMIDREIDRLERTLKTKTFQRRNPSIKWSRKSKTELELVNDHLTLTICPFLHQDAPPNAILLKQTARSSALQGSKLDGLSLACTELRHNLRPLAGMIETMTMLAETWQEQRQCPG